MKKYEVLLASAIKELGTKYIDSDSIEVQFCCPYCKSIRGKVDKDYKLYFNRNTGLYHCFKCGTSGRISNDSSIIYSISDRLVELTNNHLSDIIEDKREFRYFLPRTTPIQNSLAMDYLVSRGLNESHINYYSIRSCSRLSNIYPNRIIVPNNIQGDYTDMLVARSLDPTIDKKYKYLNPTGSRKGEVLFNFHRIPEGVEEMIIVEGVFSAISSGVNAVATYGKLVTSNQIDKIISKKSKKVIVLFDNDAKKQTIDLAKKLYSRGVNVSYVLLPDDRDPSDLGFTEVRKLIKRESVKMTRSLYKLL